MKAYFASTLFCTDCNGSLEHVGGEYVRCVNRPCPQFGLKWQIPAFDLVPYVEPIKESSGEAG